MAVVHQATQHLYSARMPFIHTVAFRWNDDVDTEHIAKVAAALDAMPSNVPSIQAYHHGPDAGADPGRNNFDYVVIGKFADADGYIAYRDHPHHVSFIADLIAGRLADRAAVDIDI